MASICKSLFLLGLAGFSLSIPVPSEPLDVTSIVCTTQTGPKVNISAGIPASSESGPKPVIGIPQSSEAGAHPVIGIPQTSESDGNAAGAAGDAGAHTIIGIPSLNTSSAVQDVLKTYSVRVTPNGGDRPASLLAMKPAMDLNFADPAIASDSNGHYWAYATDDVAKWTSNVMVHGGFNVQVANSSDFVHWTYHTADALPYAGKWSANPPHVWAPDVVRLDNGTYVLYYAATPASDTGSHCIGAAHSANASGPYTPLDEPLHCPTDEGGAIDPSGFQDPATGKRYVMFKVDGNAGQPGGSCGNINAHPRTTPIRMQEVDGKDGVSPIGNIVQILDRDASDGALVEAPSMAAITNKNATNGYSYVLFYSSHCFLTPNYNVRYAVSTNGIWNGADNCKNTTNIEKADYKKHPAPLMDTNSTNLIGPGGLDVHPDGRHVVFHAAQVASNAGTRRMHWGLVDIQGDKVTV
jgi:Glycosyl hydrolases family 43